MTLLTIHNHLTAVEQALLEVLRLSFKKKLVAADLAALAALDVTARADGDLCYVTAEQRVYAYSLMSGAAASSPDVIAPAAPPSGNAGARWLRSTMAATYGPDYRRTLHSRSVGYCNEVVTYGGQPQGQNDFLTWVIAQKPAMILQFTGDTIEPRSAGYPGSFYQTTLNYQVIVISECDRRGPWARWGSPIADEAAADPGSNAMVNQVRYVMAGQTGEDLGLQGLRWVDFGDSEVMHEDKNGRLYMCAVDLFVHCDINIVDEDLVDPVIYIEPDLADTGGAQEFDPLNYVAQGYLVPPGAGLTRSYGTGIAIIGGTTVTSTPADHTFTADRDTYRDLKTDGTFVYQEVKVDGKAPAVTSGALRVGVTRTDSSAIVADTLLCSSAFVFRDAAQVFP